MRSRIEIDPIRCEGHGLCAELLPEHVTLDDWGYPVVDGKPVDPELESLARHAARACPTLALTLRAAAVEDRRGRWESAGPGGELRDQRQRQHQPERQG